MRHMMHAAICHIKHFPSSIKGPYHPHKRTRTKEELHFRNLLYASEPIKSWLHGETLGHVPCPSHAPHAFTRGSHPLPRVVGNSAIGAEGPGTLQTLQTAFVLSVCSGMDAHRGHRLGTRNPSNRSTGARGGARAEMRRMGRGASLTRVEPVSRRRRASAPGRRCRCCGPIPDS
jgi:hypothetical protein